MTDSTKDSMKDSSSDHFQQRRALEMAIDALEKTTSEAELVQGAYAIADAYPASLALAALLKRLPTPSSQLRGGLARLATFLPEEETLRALHAYALDRGNAAQGRVTAAMVMERFLGSALRPGTLSDLQGNEDAAVQSLHDAVNEGEESLAVLVDYVTQMQQYDPGIAFQVIHHLDALEPALRVSLLRLMALDGRMQVARAALARLETLAQSGDPSYPQGANREGEERARRTLFVLIPNLPPDLAKSAEVTLRKLQFRGAGYTPPEETLRCFMGTPNFTSATALEFWDANADILPANCFLAMLQHKQGIFVSAFEETSIPKQWRKTKGVGSIHKRKHADGRLTWYVEIPAATGRALLERSIQWMLAHGQRPRGNYLECFDWLWDAPRTSADPVAARYLDGEGKTLDLQQGAKMAAKLLKLPGMDFWDLAEEVRTGTQRRVFRDADRDESAKLFIDLMRKEKIEVMLIEQFDVALRLLALWLHYAGKEMEAQDALNLAASQQSWTIEENPLIPALFAERK